MKNDMRHSDTAVMLRVENKSMMIKKPEIRKIPIPGDLKRSRIPWISKYRGSESCANIKFLRYLPKINPDSLDFGIVLSGSFQDFKSPACIFTFWRKFPVVFFEFDCFGKLRCCTFHFYLMYP